MKDFHSMAQSTITVVLTWTTVTSAMQPPPSLFSRRETIASVVTASTAATIGSNSLVAQAADGIFDPPSSSYSPERMALFDTRTESFMPPAPQLYIANALADSTDKNSAVPRVLFAGETHTHPLHHYMQLELIKAVNALDDAPLAIGLEMFHRQHQRALDAFVFGDGSFAALKQRTRWQSSWGYDMSLYAKILSFARRNKIRLVGLNVPYDLVKIVSTYGLAGTPAELRALMPDMDLGQQPHFDRFVSAMRGAGHNPSGPDGVAALMRSYEAMTLWDEYMAESIAGYMQKPRAGRMVVLVGSSHVAGRCGVPDRFTRRSEEPTFSVLPCSVPWGRNGTPNIDEPLGTSEAEWILYTQEQIDSSSSRSSSFASAAAEPKISTQALGIGTPLAPVYQI